MDWTKYAGWIVSGLVILWSIFMVNLNIRLDWMSFGADYRATLQQVVSRFEAIEQAVQSLSRRIEQIPVPPPAPSK